jgi:hypothetical protein
VVFDEAARTRLSFILRQLNRRSEVVEDKLRSFRNVLIGLQLALLLMIVVIAIAAVGEPRSWSLCGPAPAGGALVCPDGSGTPGRLDVALVELMGGLGGLLSAIFFIAGLDNFPNPHGIQLVQGLLKVPAGAALALVVTLFVHSLASLGLRLHGFGVKAGGLGRYADCLVSADSLAWSFEARRAAPLAGCSHANCANCLRYAVAWRERTLARLDVVQLHLRVAG